MRKILNVDREKLAGAMRGKGYKFAEAYNLHPNTVSYMIHKKALTIDDLNRFAEFLGRDATEFLAIRVEEVPGLAQADDTSDTAYSPLRQLVGLAKTGRPDGAANHD